MNLYISSSKIKLILKSLGFFVLLFASYVILVPLFFPGGGVSQSQWQRNIIKAQRYIYRNTDIDSVVVGTSLSARIRKDLMPEEFFNMSFTGGSIFSGLEVIKRSNRYPDVLFIETNLLMMPIDTSFMDGLFTPLIYSLRDYVPALRMEYQPVSFVQPKLQKLIVPFVNQKPESKKNMFDVILPMQQKGYAQKPDAKMFAERLEMLHSAVCSLLSEGVVPVFLEMPVHQSLVDSPKANFTRTALLRIFPPESYPWLAIPDSDQYETSDGHHLDEQSAEDFTIFLRSQLAQITEEQIKYWTKRGQGRCE